MASPVVQVRIPQHMLDGIDKARGTQTRSTWILAVIDAALRPPSAPFSQRDACDHPKARRDAKNPHLCRACGRGDL